MLTEVVLQTSDPMSFLIDDVDSDEILILTGISGLTPQDVTLFTGEFGRSGGYYQGRRFGPRYPIFNFKINPNYALDIEVSDIREMLYRQFYQPQPDSDGVTVVLKSDRRPDRFVTCYAEKWDGEIFEKAPKGQISTKCVDAFLLSVDATSASNPGGWLTVPIDYDGTGDTGFELTVKVQAATPQVTVENNGFTMVLNDSFVTDDIIEIGTTEGNRYIRKNGVDRMVLLSADSTWLQLTQAANTLKAYGTVSGDGMAVVTAYSYRSAWLGA